MDEPSGSADFADLGQLLALSRLRTFAACASFTAWGSLKSWYRFACSRLALNGRRARRGLRWSVLCHTQTRNGKPTK